MARNSAHAPVRARQKRRASRRSWAVATVAPVKSDQARAEHVRPEGETTLGLAKVFLVALERG